MQSIFKKIEFKNITINNKFVRSATNEKMANECGTINNALVEVYEKLAQNGVGLIITGHAYVSKNGMANLTQVAIYNDSFNNGLKKIVNAVKKYDSKLVCQISHAGGKAKSEEGEAIVAPSSVVIMTEASLPKELTIAEINQIKLDFTAAALRAKAVGFDGVQVHCAHGYLLSEFADPTFNKRTDNYGGNAENRFRLTREIISDIKRECGNDFPVFLKINSNIPENNEEYENDLIYVLKTCKNLGVEAVELSGYDFTSFKKDSSPYYLKKAAKLRKQINIPIILVGGIRSLNDVEQVLNAGIDMVSLSRPLICEPDLITKLKNGQDKAKCISCNQCFTLPLRKGKRCVFH